MRRIRQTSPAAALALLLELVVESLVVEDDLVHHPQQRGFQLQTHRPEPQFHLKAIARYVTGLEESSFLHCLDVITFDIERVANLFDILSERLPPVQQG